MNMQANVRAVGLDLGSTRFKAGWVDERGRVLDVFSVRAPPLSGSGDRREGDAGAYARAATELLEQAASGLSPGTALGIAVQRSTFVLWDRESGRPLTPLISWQDRRAADWCARKRKLEPEIFDRSGLVLSAHYVGPKLAAMQEHDPDLAGRLRSGRTLFGNLETFLIWQWSGGQLHETDATMAARTSMLDLRERNWSPELLEIFGVPRSILPRVRSTGGTSLPLACGLTLQATVADQAAGALAALAPNTDSALINLGTGGFVLRPCSCVKRRRGYLTALIHAAASTRCALEGTINGAGTAVDRFGDGPTALPEDDPSPRAFCLPDVAGLGSPFWRADLGFIQSPEAQRLCRGGCPARRLRGPGFSYPPGARGAGGRRSAPALPIGRSGPRALHRPGACRTARSAHRRAGSARGRSDRQRTPGPGTRAVCRASDHSSRAHGCRRLSCREIRSTGPSGWIRCSSGRRAARRETAAIRPGGSRSRSVCRRTPRSDDRAQARAGAQRNGARRSAGRIDPGSRNR